MMLPNIHWFSIDFSPVQRRYGFPSCVDVWFFIVVFFFCLFQHIMLPIFLPTVTGEYSSYAAAGGRGKKHQIHFDFLRAPLLLQLNPYVNIQYSLRIKTIAMFAHLVETNMSFKMIPPQFDSSQLLYSLTIRTDLSLFSLR